MPAGSYVLTEPNTCFFRTSQFGSDLVQNTTSLCLAGNITLAGAGAADTIIDGNHLPTDTNLTAPVAFVSNVAPVDIRGVTLRRGNFTAGNSQGSGGGINNAGTLSVVDSVAGSENTAGAGGGIYNSWGA